ncbi:hypothetical protein [Dactylosporangium sp. NPDC000521]|uniref:hypothetical protein n=1 Tax=Dactylosporangium sp. NPDC000521 TaxID=3363975 RepID=UPI003690F6B4
METVPKYTDEEWGLLVGLPQSVLIAASQAEQDGTRRTREEWTAGMTAIADGRDSASDLVRMVATDVVARQGDIEEDAVGGFAGGVEPPIIEFPDRAAGIADVIERAKAAHALLAAKASDADAESYRYWLITLADQVVSAAKSGDVLGFGGELITPAERNFRDTLAAVLEV